MKRFPPPNRCCGRPDPCEPGEEGPPVQRQRGSAGRGPPALTPYVVDASVAIKWYVPEVHHEHASRLLAGMGHADVALHAPDLFLSEAGNIIWKKVWSRECSRQEGEEILDALLAVPITIHPARLLLPSAFEVASDHGTTVHDALYVVLAAHLDCRLVTADRRLYRSLRQTEWGAFIEWLGEINSPWFLQV